LLESKTTINKHLASGTNAVRQNVEVGLRDATLPAMTQPPDRIDHTVKTTSVFSDDEDQGVPAAGDENGDEDIRALFPVQEDELDDAEAPNASQIRQRGMEGFFAPGTSDVGFKIWPDGYCWMQ